MITFLDYSGPVDHEMIDKLLVQVKKRREFTGLDRLTGRRVYAVLVECLENIARHSRKEIITETGMQPYISASDTSDKIIIRSGNTITEPERINLVSRLDLINNSDNRALNALFENEINKEIPGNNGAGLGFLVMRLRSGNNIEHNFTPIDSYLTYFELQISVNKNNMRKLIIDPTSSSPRVILDPVNNRYEISGESRPPDVSDFYREILGWLNDFSLHSSETPDAENPVMIDLDFDYFNSSSAKYILDFCKQVASMRSRGDNIGIRWFYEEEDTDMLEVGKVMSRTARITFEFIRKEAE